MPSGGLDTHSGMRKGVLKHPYKGSKKYKLSKKWRKGHRRRRSRSRRRRRSRSRRRRSRRRKRSHGRRRRRRGHKRVKFAVSSYRRRYRRRYRKCAKADYVPRIAVGFSKSSDVTKTKSDLQNVKHDLVAIKSSRQDSRTRVKKEAERVIEKVKDCRRRTNVIFDELEEAVNIGVDARHGSFGGDIQTDLSDCEAAIDKIENTIQKLQNTDKQQEAQLFVQTKISDENLKGFQKLLVQIQTNLVNDKIEVMIDRQIDEYLDSLAKLKTCIDEWNVPEPQLRTMVLQKEAKTKAVEDENTLTGTGIKLCTVVKQEDVMVKWKKDSNTCTIMGSCCLPDVGTLLADFHNNMLKRLNFSYQIIDTCSITRPQGLRCYIQPSHEAAVCVDGAIKIVSLLKQMKVVRTIKMGGIKCCGVSFCNDQLYVSALLGDKMYVYEYATGNLSLTVERDSHSMEIFNNTLHIATNRNGTRIWVADYYNGLIQLDDKCNLIRPVNFEGMGNTTGVCVDNEDNVYVCGVKPRNVMQLTSNGEKVRTLLHRDELPIDPLSISYDNIQSRLLVTMELIDTMKLIHFK